MPRAYAYATRVTPIAAFAAAYYDAFSFAATAAWLRRHRYFSPCRYAADTLILRRHVVIAPCHDVVLLRLRCYARCCRKMLLMPDAAFYDATLRVTSRFIDALRRSEILRDLLRQVFAITRASPMR